jgi:hypothetical protein
MRARICLPAPHLNARAVCHRGPGERPALQALIQDLKATVIPGQDLDTIAASIAKEEEMSGQWIKGEALADQRREPIDRTAQVRGAGREIDPNRRRDRQHDTRTACTTRRSVSAETLAATRTRSPLARTISTSPLRPSARS